MLQKCKLNFVQEQSSIYPQPLNPPPESSFTPFHLQVHDGMTAPPPPPNPPSLINRDGVTKSMTPPTLGGNKLEGASSIHLGHIKGVCVHTTGSEDPNKMAQLSLVECQLVIFPTIIS